MKMKMKMKNIIKKMMKPVYAVLIGFLFATAGCSDEWLKPEPLSELTPESTFINEAAYQAALTRCRKELNADSHGDRYFNYINWDYGATELGITLYNPNCDDWTPNTTDNNNPGNTWTDYAQTSNLFINGYQYIKNANVVITRIDDIKWDDVNVRNRILAEALWIRAYWYYRLVHSFGDIPWIGGEVLSPKIDYYSTSRWAILGQLQKDLEYAAKCLPVTPSAKGHVSKGAANHLLTKVYLANCEFDKAIESATAVINGPYALMKQRFGVYVSSKTWWNLMWDLHRWENKNHAANTETIYATVNRRDQAEDSWYRYGGVGNQLPRNYVPQIWRICVNSDATNDRAAPNSGQAFNDGIYRGYQIDTLGSGIASFRSNGYFHYSIWSNKAGINYKNTTDLRRIKGNWIEMGPEDDAVCDQIVVSNTYPASSCAPFVGQPLKRSWCFFTREGNDTLRYWYPFPYYKTYNLKIAEQAQALGGPGDMYVFRLAETYLLRAEAYWWKGQAAQAAADINEVRKRANTWEVDANDVNIVYIFDERARELYTEEPRHSEMVRVSYMFAKLNRDGYSEENITSKSWYYDRVMAVNYFYKEPRPINTEQALRPKLDPHCILWPIPQYIIAPNLLGAIKQNAGYVGHDPNVNVLQEIPEGGGGYVE